MEVGPGVSVGPGVGVIVGVVGVMVGRALYQGTVDLGQALAIAKENLRGLRDFEGPEAVVC